MQPAQPPSLQRETYSAVLACQKPILHTPGALPPTSEPDFLVAVMRAGA